MDGSVEPPGSESAGDAAAGPSVVRVRRLVDALVKGVRAHRIYQHNNEAYLQILSSLRAELGELWDCVPALDLEVEDRAFRWEGERVEAGGGRGSLAFLFYKDGIRRVRLLPGFERELVRFLDVVGRARHASDRTDDLVTLLWEQDFTCLQYVYVDILAEGLTVPERGSVSTPAVDAERIAEAAAAGGRPPEPPPGAASADVAPPPRRGAVAAPSDILTDAELDDLRRQAERAVERDVREAVLAALFDRLDDAAPRRRDEIIGILGRLLPEYLKSGRFRYALMILRVLDGPDPVDGQHGADSPDGRHGAGFPDGPAGEAGREDAAARVNALSDPDLLVPVVRSIDEGEIEPTEEEVVELFGHLRPPALPVLLREAAAVDRTGLRERLRDAIADLARREPGRVRRLLESDDPAVAAGAASLVGRLRLDDAVPDIAPLLDRDSPEVRLAAVEALLRLGSGEALAAVRPALEDPGRDVRVAAARGIGAAGDAAASPALARMLESRALRGADLTEKIAFFEAYGAVGGAEAVDLLDGILNGRTLLGRRHPADFRACAARALGRLDAPGAREALVEAEDASNPTVRTAVARALNRGGADG